MLIVWEVKWIALGILPNLTYILSAGYSHAEYYHNLDKSHEGNRIVMAPEFTGNTGFIYQKAVKTSCFRCCRFNDCDCSGHNISMKPIC
ncbi:MAG: hypothetical protein ACLU30_01920 [Odoribacter splanchnicus]